MEETGTIRSFVAIELPPDALDYCEEATIRAKRLLGSAESAVRWVRPEGIHITLKFLGSVPGDQVPELARRLTATLANQPVFSLTIHGLGVFPNPRSPRVVWLGLEGDLAALDQAQQRVEEATEPLGYPREKQPFRPHLTLGRVREGMSSEDLAEIGRLAREWPEGSGVSFAATAASLMRSNLGRGGSRYTRLAEIPFVGVRGESKQVK